MPEEPNVRKLDARSLRGLAHPLRMQLLVDWLASLAELLLRPRGL